MKAYIKKIHNLNDTQTDFKEKLNKFLKNPNKEEYENTFQNIKEIIKEGFYINESLNHLIYFINKKSDANYQIEKHYENKQTHDEVFSCICGKTYKSKESLKKHINENKQTQKNITNEYDSSKYFYNPSDPKSNSNYIRTIPILEKIFNKKGTSGINPKIIMFCNVRLDNNKCIDTKKSLEFAQQIKST